MSEQDLLDPAQTDMPDPTGEDYLLQQLKETVLRRQASMGRVRQAYEDDPRAGRSPTSAGLRAHISQPGIYGVGTPTYGPMFDAMDAQEKFLFENKVNPELLQLKEDDADPFTKLLAKVQSNKKAVAKSFKPDVKVVGGSLVKYDSATDSTQVLFSDVKNSPLYAKIWDQIYTGSLNDKMQFKDDNARRAYVSEQTNTTFAQAVANDSTKLGSQTPPVGTGAVELPRGPLTGANQSGRPTVIGSTPAMIRPNNGELRKESAMAAGLSADTLPGRPINKNDPSGNVFGPPVHNDPTKDPRFGAVQPVANGNESPTLLTVRDKKVAEKLAEGEVTDYNATKDQMKSMYSANENIRPMEGILLSGKHTSGQLHETLNKIGGYFNYIDPNGTLAQSAGNDSAYFGSMMNLVRDKIKALGSGTAVSNLDLIVTQKSVGDLRNTPQGNLKVLGLTKLFNATMADQGQNKIDYFDQNGKLQGYKMGTEPTYAIRATRNPYKDGSIMSYDVQSKGDWIKEQMRRNPGKDIPPDVLSQEWKRFADDSVRAMFK